LPTLNSSDLLAGYTFDQGSLSPKLSRPVILSGAAQRNTVSASPNSGDAASLPLPTQQVQMTLPYPPGEAVQVIQGYDAANGSHKGYASFCWDFKLADQPQGGTYPLGSNGQPFYAAAPGKVITIKQGGVSGNSNPPNLAEIEQASGEVAGYLHLQQNSAVVNVNDNAAQGQQLALTGDTGAGVGAYHLHFATTDKPDGAFGFVTFPIAFSNYEVRDGVNWNLVLRGIPKSGEVIRARPFTSSAKAFVFLANKVTLKRTKQNTPAGNMHSNGTLTVEKGDPSAYNSNLTAVGKITIQKDNTINGNVTSNTALDNQGTINGNAAVGLINPEPLPGKSYIAGGSNATVPSGGMLALAPSSYGIVTLNGSGVLKLSSGNYYMNELRYPGSEAVIEIDLASGNPVTINVVNNLQLGKEVEIRLLPNGEADSKLVAFNTLQSSQVDVGKEAYFLGALNAPNAKVVLKKNSQLRGAICANEIVVERDCLFLHHDSPGSLPGPGNLPKSSESEESEVSESEVVASYELAQNYPNPFNPSTVISFQLPVDSEASLKIYNLNGQLVKLLVAGKLEAGRHKVVWDGKNEAGVPVASGVYVYVLKAGDFTAQRKLVLMK
jgi:murein DD-endopeptidase MepM/ murein hydrolase activator NlpD